MRGCCFIGTYVRHRGRIGNYGQQWTGKHCGKHPTVVYRPHRRASAASEPIRRTMSSAKSGLLCLDSRLQLLGCRGARKLLQEVVAFSDPLRFKPTHSDSLHSNSFTRRATRAVVGADCEKADGIYLKRPPPAQAPCPRANPGLHLATLQASGRVALAPRRCAVTRA